MEVIRNQSRDRLINAIIFFVENTARCHKIKLWKLLYFLDFEHFQQVGRNVTGLDYYAWPMGPVPQSLHEEIDQNSEIDDRIEISISDDPKYPVLSIYPRSTFDPTIFTPRQLKIMERLVNDFREADAPHMVNKTHLENQPWHQVFEVEKRRQAHIPYSLAIRSSEATELQELVNSREEFERNFS